ncbi:uncharacterized protein LOC128233076 [Mya arenaria]|nr:uncharacterized protein LOC128233076 [Mya arenaria]
MHTTMSVRRCLCSRHTFVWLLVFHATALGVLLLMLFDRLTSSPTNPYHKAAFERWMNIRDNFDVYQKEQIQQDEMMKHKVQWRQMDAVMSFNDINKDPHNTAEEFTALQKRIKEEERRMDEAVKSANVPLDYIPPVPEFSEIDIVPYLASNITNKYLRLPKSLKGKKSFKKEIVILTPVCDVAHLIENFVKALANLSYPHEKMSVYFGEDSSTDETYSAVLLAAQELKSKHGFRDAAVFRFNVSGGVHGSWDDIHAKGNQLLRRSHLAKARNMLLKESLSKTHPDYVLWIDSDVKTLPDNLIQHLLYAKSDVVVPSCLFIQGRFKKFYDRNSWRETPTSIEDQAELPKDVLLVEGYSHSTRIFLPDLKAEGRVVHLDGVGGCVLMVRTECHRKGLVFTEEVYEHHIETEGLGKMANNMGFSVNGLPWVEVFHN